MPPTDPVCASLSASWLWFPLILVLAQAPPWGCERCAEEESFTRIDITEVMVRHMPFLKKGLVFLDVFPGHNPGHGELHYFHVRYPDGTEKRISSAEEFAPLVERIDTPEQALSYVRHLSERVREGGRVPFDDVPFWEIRRKEFTGPRLELAGKDLSRAQETSVTGNPSGGFVVRRFGIFRKDVEGQRTLFFKLRQMARITEIVFPDGRIEREIESIPTDDLTARSFPLMMD